MRRKRDEVDPVRQAATWRIQAGILRRRAARAEAAETSTAEERAESIARAEWHERRADLVDAAYPAPAIFPPELRTPVDRLDLVDDLRRACDALVMLSHAVDDAEIVAFGEAVRRARGPVLPVTRAITMVRHACELARDAAQALGVQQAPFGESLFEDYAIEIVEGDELDNPPAAYELP
jgi:hypothetical protein